MKQDFPAAHSMDTTWFAVDADGNIGIFDSGEGGAVPEATANLRFESRLKKKKSHAGEKNRYDWVESIHDLFCQWSKENEDRVVRLKISAAEIIQQLEIDLNQFGLDNLRAIEPRFKVLPAPASIPKIENSEFEGQAIEENSIYEYTHWLLSIAEEREAELIELFKQYHLPKNSTNYIVRFAGEPPLLFLMEFPEDTLTILFEQGFVKSAVPLESNGDGVATLFGFFCYLQDSSVALPYECNGVPLHSLNPSALPENLQNWISLNRFDRIQFSDSPKIQPIEHMRCISLTYDEQCWVDCEGNERFGHPYN